MGERQKELEKLLNSVCGQYEDNCEKCPYKKECEEYAKLEVAKERLNGGKNESKR